MANVLSTLLTNLFATPAVRNNSIKEAGQLFEVCSTAAPAANQSNSDFIHFARVPSNARVSEVLLSCADATTAGAVDVGVYTYDPIAAVFTVVDADLFASAVDLSGGPMLHLDITLESGEYSYAEMEKPLWEVLGLTSDPGIFYYIGADITTTFNGGPTTVNLKVRYVQ